MKKFQLITATLVTLVLVSCGSSQKNVASGEYYETPFATMARQENGSLRSVGSARSFIEDVAAENAESNALSQLASRLATAVTINRDRYDKNTQGNTKVATEQEIQNHVVQFVDNLHLSYNVIGGPKFRKESDGSITAYVCIELTKNVESIAGQLYDTLTREEILSIDYDREKFINEYKNDLQSRKKR